MSVLGQIQSGSSRVTAGVGAGLNLARHLGLFSADAGQAWFEQLQPASWRGVPFGVLGQDGSFGRRSAIHTYPYRDTIWPEDMGRAPRRLSLTGFLIGDDVVSRLQALMAAAEKADKGELVHPLLGRMSMVLLHGRQGSTWEQGRVVEIRLDFIEAGDRIFPTTAADTGAAVLAAAGPAQDAAAGDFGLSIGDALKAGAAVVKTVAGTVAAWSRSVQRLVDDVTNLADLTDGDGRYSAARRRRSVNQKSAAPKSSGAKAAAGRVAVKKGIEAISVTSTTVTASRAGALAVTARALVDAVSVAIPDPANAIRVLIALSAITPQAPLAAAPLGKLRAAGQMAVIGLLRRLVVIEAAVRATEYQPSSYDDAVALSATVGQVLDAEILAAADDGRDDSYAALKAVQAAVIDDLTSRGASLAHVTTVSTSAPMPALALAQLLYQDSGRADELIVEADPVHPAFMPTMFKALAR